MEAVFGPSSSSQSFGSSVSNTDSLNKFVRGSIYDVWGRKSTLVTALVRFWYRCFKAFDPDIEHQFQLYCRKHWNDDALDSALRIAGVALCYAVVDISVGRFDGPVDVFFSVNEMATFSLSLAYLACCKARPDLANYMRWWFVLISTHFFWYAALSRDRVEVCLGLSSKPGPHYPGAEASSLLVISTGLLLFSFTRLMSPKFWLLPWHVSVGWFGLAATLYGSATFEFTVIVESTVTLWLVGLICWFGVRRRDVKRRDEFWLELMSMRAERRAVATIYKSMSRGGEESERGASAVRELDRISPILRSIVEFTNANRHFRPLAPRGERALRALRRLRQLVVDQEEEGQSKILDPDVLVEDTSEEKQLCDNMVHISTREVLYTSLSTSRHLTSQHTLPSLSTMTFNIGCAGCCGHPCSVAASWRAFPRFSSRKADLLYRQHSWEEWPEMMWNLVMVATVMLALWLVLNLGDGLRLEGHGAEMDLLYLAGAVVIYLVPSVHYFLCFGGRAFGDAWQGEYFFMRTGKFIVALFLCCIVFASTTPDRLCKLRGISRAELSDCYNLDSEARALLSFVILFVVVLIFLPIRPNNFFWMAHLLVIFYIGQCVTLGSDDLGNAQIGQAARLGVVGYIFGFLIFDGVCKSELARMNDFVQWHAARSAAQHFRAVLRPHDRDVSCTPSSFLKGRETFGATSWSALLSDVLALCEFIQVVGKVHPAFANLVHAIDVPRTKLALTRVVRWADKQDANLHYSVRQSYTRWRIFADAPDASSSSFVELPELGHLHSYFLKYADGAPKTVSALMFLQFLLDVQGDSLTDLKSVTALLAALRPPFVDDTTGELTQLGFSAFLTSDENTIYQPDRTGVFQDMSQPIARYWISSSHNTYCEGGQLTGRCSASMYMRVLLRHARCLEIDTWDGPDGAVVVTHGKTLMSKVALVDVLDVISTSAFRASPYPVILSIEQRCKRPESIAVIAAAFERFFGVDSPEGDRILRPPREGEEPETLPSPEETKRHFIIKAKLLEPPKNCSNRISRGIMAYNQCIYLCARDSSNALHFASGWADDVCKGSVRHLRTCASWGEVGVKKHLNRVPRELLQRVAQDSSGDPQKEALRRYHRNYCTRIYPRSTRISSSNYDPSSSWFVGAQLVAMNLQTYDWGTLVNEGRFRSENGGAGYVLKPCAINSEPPNIPSPNPFADGQSFSRPSSSRLGKFGQMETVEGQSDNVRLCLEVLSGLDLPRTSLVGPRRSCVFVRVGIAGGTGKVHVQTRAVPVTQTIGILSLVFDEGWLFEINQASCAILTFEVLQCVEGNVPGVDSMKGVTVLGAQALPVQSARSGLRIVTLWDHQDFEAIPNSALLVRVGFKPATKVVDKGMSVGSFGSFIRSLVKPTPPGGSGDVRLSKKRSNGDIADSLAPSSPPSPMATSLPGGTMRSGLAFTGGTRNLSFDDADNIAQEGSDGLELVKLERNKKMCSL